MTETTIRPLARGDEAAWRTLWTAYLDFYDTRVPDAQYAETFARLLSDDPWQPSGIVAEREGGVVGIVHYLFHSHCWRPERSCYLQDLYVDAAARGSGAGRRLIEAVYAAADEENAPVYWITQEGNAAARRLYDTLAAPTGSIVYARHP